MAYINYQLCLLESFLKMILTNSVTNKVGECLFLHTSDQCDMCWQVCVLLYASGREDLSNRRRTSQLQFKKWRNFFFCGEKRTMFLYLHMLEKFIWVRFPMLIYFSLAPPILSQEKESSKVFRNIFIKQVVDRQTSKLLSCFEWSTRPKNKQTRCLTDTPKSTRNC